MTTMKISTTLGPGVDAAIRRHGEETYPHECCGALIGSGGVVTHAVAAAEHDRGRTAAPVSGAAVGLSPRGAARAGELGGELLGFYHSHPDHPARPSQFDLDHAWPTFAYVIVSVASGRAGDMTVWFLKEDRSSFDEGELNGDENPDSNTAAAVHG